MFVMRSVLDIFQQLLGQTRALIPSSTCFVLSALVCQIDNMVAIAP